VTSVRHVSESPVDAARRRAHLQLRRILGSNYSKLPPAMVERLIAWKLERNGGGMTASEANDPDDTAQIAPAEAMVPADAGATDPAMGGEEIRHLDVIVRSMSGEVLMTLAPVDGSWQRPDVMTRLVRIAPPPQSHVYKLVSAHGAVLAGACTLADLAAQAKDGDGVEAEAPCLELVAILLENPEQPKLEEARSAVLEMHRNIVMAARAYARPPHPVALTVMALALLADIHVDLPHNAADEERLYAYWGAARDTVLVPQAMLSLLSLNPEDDPQKILTILGPLVARADFQPLAVGQVSIAFALWCSWCHALHGYCSFLISAGVI